VTEKQLRRAPWNTVFDFLDAQPDARKKQLAFCACCRVTWHLVERECNRAAIEASEAFADGQLALRTLKRRWNAMRFEPVVYSQWMLNAAGPANGEFPNLSPQTEADGDAVEAFEEVEGRESNKWERAWAERVIDVFGHLLTDYRFERAWATDTAIAVARQMYDSRDFSAMPILADALQDAGCEYTTILDHCRDTTRAHCRGCWVVDLVLGL
jgi:hypothetical protein